MKLIMGIVMSGILGFFSSNKSIPFGAERTIDLGVAKLSFSLQEDFSKDMPAEPLIEKIDIRQKESLQQLDNGLILQRWWDIKESGFFGKNIGMLMMSIGVHQAPQNKKKYVHDKPYNLLNRLDLMLSLSDRFHQMYDEHNEQAISSGNEDFGYHGASLFSGFKDDYSTSYRDDIIGQTKWISYGISGQNWERIVVHVLPLSRESFLEVRFTYSPEKSKISSREFNDFVHETRATPTFNQFQIEFSEQASDVKALVQGKWLTETNDEVMESHIELLREKFPPGEAVKYIPPPEENDVPDMEGIESSDDAWEPMDKR